MEKNFIGRREYDQTNNNFMSEIKQIRQCINDIKINIAGLPEKLTEKLDEKYVSQESFKPIQKIVYGLVGAILISVFVALLALVIK